VDRRNDSSEGRKRYILRPLWKGIGLSLLSLFFFSRLCAEEGADQLLERAEGAYVAGDFKNALRFYDEFLNQYASHEKMIDALYWRARTLLIMDQFQEARQTFHQVVEKTENLSLKEEAQLGYADSLYYVGELEAALFEYEAILNTQGSAHIAYLLFQIGSIWKSRGDFEKTDTFFKKLIQDYPDSYEAHQVLKANSLHAEGLYYIQVGVFHVHANIERLIPKIESLQYPYRVEEIKTAAGKAYKVKVGGFREGAEARKAVGEIEKMAQVRGRVVKE
jgi:tetratricopeptide (TPR) repeat protein